MDSTSSDQSPIDSARILLQDLRLVADNRIGGHMDPMDVDLALEVPDTPERSSTVQGEENSSRNPRRGVSFNNRNPRRGVSFNHHRSTSSSNRMDDDNSPSRKGRLASSISLPSESNISRPTQFRSARRRTGQHFRRGEGQNSHVNFSTERNMVDVSAEIRENGIDRHSNEIDETQMPNTQRLLNDDRSKGIPSANEEASSSHTIRGNPDKGKGVYVSNGNSSQSKVVSEEDSQRRNSGPRKLVRNGLISPVNIANNSVISRGRDEQETGFVSRRELLLPCNNSAGKAEVNADPWPSDNAGWRSTRQIPKAEFISCQPSDQHSRHVPDDGRALVHGIDSTLAASSSSSSSSRQPRRGHISRRKSGSSNPSRVDEISGSRVFGNEAGTSSAALHDQSRTVIDVDELPSPAARNFQDHEFHSREQQLMLDEIFARQLQEEFFNESALFDASNEFNANMARSIPQEENARRSSARDRSRPRESLTVSHLNRQFSRRSPQNTRSNSSHFNHHRVAPTLRMAQMRRNLQRAVDLETRLNFLEMLEVGFSVEENPGSNVNNFLHLHRDFGANDYEMLLALDNHNHRPSGATRQQIDNLPESILLADKEDEACAICLDSPSAGDVVRHLPCLHRFHKNCIDEWLRRKSSCPICKSEIT